MGPAEGWATATSLSTSRRENWIEGKRIARFTPKATQNLFVQGDRKTSAGRQARQSAAISELIPLGAVTLWALNFSAIKYLFAAGVTPLGFNAVRYGLAALAFLAIAYAREGDLWVRQGDGAAVVAVGACMFVNQTAFVFALKFGSASTTALVFGITPVIVAAVAWIGRRERITARHTAALTVSVCGAAMVAVGAGAGMGDPIGIACAFVAASTWALYSVIAAPLMQRYSTFRVNALALSVSWLLFVVVGTPELLGQELRFNWLAWAAFWYAVLGALVLTNALWFLALGRIGPSRAALYVNIELFLAVIFAVVLLSESVTVVQCIGGGLVGAAIMLASARVPGPLWNRKVRFDDD